MKSISLKITIVVLGLLVLVQLIDSTRAVRSLREQLTQELDKRGNALAHSAAIFCIEPILGNDYPHVESFVKDLVEPSGVAYARIMDQHGKVIANSPGQVDGVTSKGFRAYSAPIVFKVGEDVHPLGEAHIQLSTADVDRNLQARTEELLLTGLALFSLTAGLLILFLNRLISRPVVRLARAASRLGEGDLESSIDLPGKDEIGRLAGTLDLMRERLGNSYHDLQLKNQELEELGRVKDEFLANMSHEIRTPMNGVLGMVSLLMDTKLNREQREYADAIRNSGSSLLSLINDILDVSKIQAGKLVLETIPFDLHSTIDEVAGLLAANARNKNLDFAVRYAPESPRQLIGDPTRIRQVLTNLVGNAIKFTEKGHVFINVECEQLSDREARVRINVEDTGIGISTEKTHFIFQQFTQVDSSVTREYGGTGLGLTISQRLVELMGGQLAVESEVGKGSKFSFVLDMDIAQARDSFCAPNFQGIRALVIDDTRILEEQLGAWRMRVSTVSTGAEALQLLRQAKADGAPFDLAVIDQCMPEMDGEDLARSIRTDRGLRDIKMIMRSTSNESEAKARFMKLGFSAYLRKPTRRDQLLLVLQDIMTDPGTNKPSQPSALPFTNDEHVDVAAEDNEGISVLVVEDNLVNQKVANRMLQKLGCQVDTAENGEEGVEAAKKKNYDVIFMDCMMPIMDGYEATRVIRRREEEMGGHVRIVALTANAMKGDREKCLACGMDDYLSKPVTRKTLQTTLAHWVREEQSEVELQPKPMLLPSQHR